MYATLLAAAAEKSAPLIDLDGTVLIQFAIFVVMVIVLTALVFRPFLKVHEARRKGTSGSREAATATESKAAEIVSSVDAKVVGARRRAEAERVALRAEAANHEREVLGAARDTAAKAIADAKAEAERQHAALRATLLAEVQPLARQVATRVLGRNV